MIRKLLLVTAAVAALGACTPREERTATGALIGAGAGAIIGNATSPDQVCYGRDELGRRVRYAC